MAKFRPFLSVLLSIAGAVAYGLFIRLAFASEQLSTLFGTISLGFLVFVPLALGALTVFFAPESYRRSWVYAVFTPLLSCTLFAALAAALSLEAWICVVMALPIFWAMAMLGGLATFLGFYWRDKAKRGPSQTGLIGLLLFSPFLITPLENLLPVQDSIRTVHTQIEVKAAPEVVWQNITRVSEITEAEHHWSFFHLAGLPRPSYATLGYEGVGGVRRGQWEDGLAFTETIIDWQLYRRYTMRMEADLRQLQPSSLPLQEIGGRYFDVIEGQYRLEPAGENKVILHFTSTHRLTTRFNFYGGLWTDLFMRDVQNYILRIVKARAEAALLD